MTEVLKASNKLASIIAGYLPDGPSVDLFWAEFEAAKLKVEFSAPAPAAREPVIGLPAEARKIADEIMMNFRVGADHHFSNAEVMMIERICHEVAARSAASTVEPVALQVWYGPMPESNGRSNFTAILHKGELSQGHTIARSEYPERVRYEADRVRWLIGELKEEPFILDYDADKHSGYAAPTTSPEPDAVREQIARIIDGRAFDGWQGQYDYAIKDNPADFAQRCADAYYKEAKDQALEKADAILAALSRPAHGGWKITDEMVERGARGMVAALMEKDPHCKKWEDANDEDREEAVFFTRAAITAALARNDRAPPQPDTDGSES